MNTGLPNVVAKVGKVSNGICVEVLRARPYIVGVGHTRSASREAFPRDAGVAECSEYSNTEQYGPEGVALLRPVLNAMFWTSPEAMRKKTDGGWYACLKKSTGMARGPPVSGRWLPSRPRSWRPGR